MSKQDNHTGALYCKISGELYMMPYTGKDVQDLRNTLKFDQDLQRNLYAEIKRNKEHISALEALEIGLKKRVDEQGAQIQKLLTEKIELSAKVDSFTELLNLHSKGFMSIEEVKRQSEEQYAMLKEGSK